MEPRCARVARSAICLLVAAGLAAPAAVARDPARTPAAQDVWDTYPLRQAQQPAASPGGSRSGASVPTAAPAHAVERLALASVLALIVGGLVARLATLRRPGARTLSGAAPPGSAFYRSALPELWAHSADAPTTPADAERAPPTPAPPEPDRAWAAEIGWRLVDGESQFSIAARPVDGGAEPITLGESSPLEWPPRGARSVQALADAVKALESTLVAAGWTPLPRGSAWYAKRFAWQPGARPRP